MTYRTLAIAILAAVMALPLPSGVARGQDAAVMEPLKMTLSDSVFIALRNNRSLKSAYLGRTLDKFNLKVAEDEFIPDLTISLSTGHTSSKPSDTRTTSTSRSGNVTLAERIPTGGTFTFTWANSSSKATGVDDSYDTSWDLSFSQPLLRGGGLEAGTASLRSARIQEEQNLLSYKNTIIGTITSTINSFRSYIQSKRQYDISEKSLGRARKLLEINKALIEAGRMARVEIVQTEADIANRKFSLLSARNNLDSARLALIQILDIDKNTRFEPVEEPGLPEVDLDLERLTKVAFDNRADYKQALLSLKTAEISLAVARNNRLWDLSLTAGANQGESGPDYSTALDELGNMDKVEWTAGLSLNIPIGDLSRRQSFLSAKINLKRVKMDLKELTESLELEVQNAVRDVGMKLKQVELARLARDLSEQKLEIEQVRLKTGRSSNFQLVNFQNDLVYAQNNELDTLINYINALTGLDRTLGTTLETWKIELIDGSGIATTYNGEKELLTADDGTPVADKNFINNK